jgi:cytochrome o ubiquinol oxidase subunit 1
MLLGKLTLDAIPYKEPILVAALSGAGLLGLVVMALITKFGKWGYLWKEWLTSVDHKKIGVMYIVVAMIMLLRGFADALMMRAQLAMATEGSPGYLPPEHYDQIFTAHGVIMIIFMAMPFFTGLMNLAVPLQIGARDVAFPFLNSLSFWLLVSGVVLINLSLGVIIHIYILAKLMGKEARFIMTPEYQRIIAATPHVKYKTSILVKVLLALLLILLIGIIVAASFSK